MTETTRPTSVRVIADHTPGPHRTDSDDLCWWLPIIGPTASVLAYRFARHAAHAETLLADRGSGPHGRPGRQPLQVVAQPRTAPPLPRRPRSSRPTRSRSGCGCRPSATASSPCSPSRWRLPTGPPPDARADAGLTAERRWPGDPRPLAPGRQRRCRPAGGCGGCVDAPGRSSPSFLGAKPFGLTGRSSSTPPRKGEPSIPGGERKETEMNTVTVTGWLQSDPMTEHVGDLAVCELRLAVERPGPDRRTELVSVTCFGRLAVIAAERLTDRRLRRSDRLAAHPARRHRRRPGSPAGRRRGRAARLPRRTRSNRPWRPTRTSRPPTTTATSSTRCRDDRHSDRTVVTCAVLDWADVEPSRMAWLAGCLARHLTADWGDLDADDRAANDHALRHGQGRVLSAYELPADLAGDDRRAAGVGDHRRPRGPRHRHDHPLAQRLLTTTDPSRRPLPSRQGPRRVRPPARLEPLTPVGASRGADFSHRLSPGGCTGCPLVGDAVDRQAPRRSGGLPAVRRRPVPRRLLHGRRRGERRVGRRRRRRGSGSTATSTPTICGRCSPAWPRAPAG